MADAVRRHPHPGRAGDRFLLLSVLGKGTTVEKAYLVILDTMLLVYFIPYIYLFTCFLVVRPQGAIAGQGTAREPARGRS